MEETSANISTDDPSKLNHCQSENATNNECEIRNRTTPDPKPQPQPQPRSQSQSVPGLVTVPSASINLSAGHVNSKLLASAETSGEQTKNKAVVLSAPNVETICDDIATTTKEIKRLKHVQIRSNSTGKLYQSSRRVSFPENDSELVTGYLEPADPWACGK